MGKLQDNRIRKIQEVKRILQLNQEQNLKVDEKEFLIETMSFFKVSKYIAKEYIEQALFELAKEKKTLIEEPKPEEIPNGTI